MMKIYYWEIINPDRHGEFKAESDSAAKARAIDRKYDFVYRESDTPDGQPFITILDLRDEENPHDPFGDIRRNT